MTLTKNVDKTKHSWNLLVLCCSTTRVPLKNESVPVFIPPLFGPCHHILNRSNLVNWRSWYCSYETFSGTSSPYVSSVFWHEPHHASQRVTVPGCAGNSHQRPAIWNTAKGCAGGNGQVPPVLIDLELRAIHSCDAYIIIVNSIHNDVTILLNMVNC